MVGWEGAGGMPISVRDNRGGEWWWAHNAIIDRYAPAIGAYGVAVYCALCRYAGRDQQTWVSQRTLREHLGLADATVRKALRALQDAALVEIEEQKDDRGRTTNLYTLLPVRDAPTAAREVAPARDEAASLTRRGALQFMEKTHGERDPTELDELWKTALADLREQVTPSNYARWLARARLLERSDGTAVVGAPDALTAKQLAGRLDALVRRALSDACGEPVAVAYVVADDARTS